MPKAIYTAAKGLYESTDTGSGFSISDAPIILGTQAVELKQIVYTLTFTGVTTVDDEENGAPGSDDGTTAYQNQTFDLYDADGNAITFGFTHTNNGGAGGTLGVDATTHTGTAISISDGDTDSDIASAVATAISGYDSSGVFSVATAGAVLTVYVKKPGILGDTFKTLVEDQSILDTIATGATTATFAVTNQGATSRVAGYINSDRGNNRAAPTVNQIHGAGLSVVTLEQDNADAAIELAFADGDDVGQEKFIHQAASVGDVILTGNFQKAAATGTKLTLAAGNIEWLIWNGSQWYLALDVGAIA